jgi:hypothetical protein
MFKNFYVLKNKINKPRLSNTWEEANIFGNLISKPVSVYVKQKTRIPHQLFVFISKLVFVYVKQKMQIPHQLFVSISKPVFVYVKQKTRISHQLFVFISELVHLSVKMNGQFFIHQIIDISLAPKRKHQIHQRYLEKGGIYVDKNKKNFDESIALHEKMNGNKDKNDYDLLVPENILSPNIPLISLAR